MANTWQEQLAKVFPGSTTPLIFEKVREVQEKDIEKWDAKPFIFLVDGKEREFFAIGQLGKALGNRSAVTLRKWERDGIIGKSPYTKPSSDPRGRRRMYTRAMVEGLVRIAREEGILWPDKGKRLSDTNFSVKALALFRKLLNEERMQG